MSKRKKRKKSSKSKPRKLDDENLGTLADAFSSRLKAEARQAGAPERPSRAEPSSPAQARQSKPAPTPEEPTKLTPKELMERAFQAADMDAIYDGKYLGAGYDAGDVEVEEEPRSDEPAAPIPVELDEPTGDDMLFFEAVGAETKPIEHRQHIELDARGWVGASWHDDVELRSLSAEDLMEPRLTGDQRLLLRKSRRGQMPVLNIRHMRRAEALREVEAFVRAHRIDQIDYVRIITGKGKQSAGNPVLKPALIEWCEGLASALVRGWAPETDRSGNYGSVVLHLDLRAAT